MSTVLIFGFLLVLAYGAGVCFGYGITTLIDINLKEKMHSE